MVNNATTISDLFEAASTFTAGNIPPTTEPIPFEGGDNGEPVVSGTRYIVY